MLVGITAARSPSLKFADEQTRRLFRLFETVAVAGPGHAQRIVQYDDQRHRTAAGEQAGAGLKNRIGEQERQTDHRQSPQRQQQPVAQAVAARDAFLRQQDEADGGEADALQAAPIEQMNQHRQRRRGQAEEKQRVEKKNRHASAYPRQLR